MGPEYFGPSIKMPNNDFHAGNQNSLGPNLGQMISGTISALARGIFTAWNPCVSTYFYLQSGTRNITTNFTLDKSKQLCIPISSFIFL